MPPFNPATWDFRTWAEGEQERAWTWNEFNKLPRSKLLMDIHCVTRWSKSDTLWEGVSVRTLVEQGLIKIKPSAQYVMQHAEYGFTVNLPLKVVLQENFLLATLYNGEPLTSNTDTPCVVWWAPSPGGPSSQAPTCGKAPSGCAGWSL